MTAVEVVCTVSASYGPALLTGGAVFLSTAIGTTMAYLAIRSQRQIARRRATLDMIQAYEEREFYKRGLMTFRELHEMGRLEDVLDPKTAREREDQSNVQGFLNHYELIAVGIEQGVLDEKFYCQWMRTSYIATWRAAEPVVRRVREIQPTAYVNFEACATRWMNRTNPS